MFYYDQQEVSDIAHFLKGSHNIFFYDQQEVSDIAHFMKSSLVTSLHSLWVTLHIW